MKISNNFLGIKMSAAGMSIQRKKMNLISENLANTSTTKTDNGTPYQRKFLVVKQEGPQERGSLPVAEQSLKMTVTQGNHMPLTPAPFQTENDLSPIGMKQEELIDKKDGDVVYMPEHPDADQDGYVHMPNVNVVTEMVDMIAATRSYEANLTALNSSKQMAKDALEI
ncbi:MAG: flagellar basal body rod protein FlgC [Syntrophothermus sp.]